MLGIGHFRYFKESKSHLHTMASELTRPRPPTRTGSGSRPPTSRFQEGSMNDRISAAPPAQFLGPEQLKSYETQFYQEPPMLHEARRPRPFSASGQLQATAAPRHVDGGQPPQPQPEQRQTVTHKKSMGFFGRVRDALFHRGGGGGQHGQTLKQQELRRKHSSLQEPLQHPHSLPPPPRPDYLRAERSQSDANMAQMFSGPRGMADRPSREDVVASYNQLMASGFFQSHAIQSTRHAAPTMTATATTKTTITTAAPAAAAGGRQKLVLSMEHLAAPRPPDRVSSMHATARSSSVSPMPVAMPSPKPQDRSHREHATVTATATAGAPAAPRSSLSSLFRPSIPDLQTKDSRYGLRGRKRNREDTPVTTPEPQASSSTTTSSTSYFTQPLRRVAKKLREMPSSSFQASNETSGRNGIPLSRKSSYQNAAAGAATPAAAADEAVHIPPSMISSGPLQPNDRPMRLYSRSPAPPEIPATRDSERRGERKGERSFYERASSATRARPPRKTFSYVLTERDRGRSRTGERERDHERKPEPDTTRRQRRGSSAGRADSATRAAAHKRAIHTRNPLGQWQRVSLEDTIIHRDAIDSMREQQQQQVPVHVHVQGHGLTSPDTAKRRGLTTATTTTTQSSPLRVMSDVNRSSVPKTPERWHVSGKAYHLKDRGSRPDLAVRRSQDSGNAEGNYGNENENENDGSENRRPPHRDYCHHHDGDSFVVDADGDIDLLACETRKQQQQKQRREQRERDWQHQQEQWRIGNAL
ncbi:hypothetical protein F5B17DRAFT_442110 [Nemania serpens]|nr:hypothetical protein F5B17DRAFT_442110 [Nemania serpens]